MINIDDLPPKYREQARVKLAEQKIKKSNGMGVQGKEKSTVNKAKKPSKHRNKKTEIDGIKFDSKKEAERYLVLKDLQDKKQIKSLVLQPRFLLQDKFTKNGKSYRKIEYIADFMYLEKVDGKWIEVVEDVKASKKFLTDVYKIKKKLFEFKYENLTIREIF